MFPEPRPRPKHEKRTGPGNSRALRAAKRKAHEAGMVKAVLPTPTVEHVVWSEALIRATSYDNIDGRVPMAQQAAKIQPTQVLTKAPSAIAADEALLKEDLLSNDSLGG